MLCILGPTASGKTGLAVEFCQAGGHEIISVDSALVYKRMNIGTAKPDAETQRVAPHALIDLIEPWETYSVARFLVDIEDEINRIARAGQVPVLVGGTMLYFNALWKGLSSLPESNSETREKIQREAESKGWQEMHQRLSIIDSVSAGKIHPNDPQRILRALEVFELAGVPLSELQDNRSRNDYYDFFNIGLFPSDRALLHKRIEQRFTTMLKQDFADEVRSLMQLPEMNVNLTSMRCVGYRQMWSHLSDECSEREMTDRAVAATRQLAKRQLTWMRRMENLALFDVPAILESVVADAGYILWRDKHKLN